jgi:cell division protein ZipA
MPELRWTLLIIGVLFIAILAWWEKRRPHQASRQAPHIGADPRAVVTDDAAWGPDAGSGNSRIARESALNLPEIRTEVRAPLREREPTSTRELPVVEIPGDSLVGLRADEPAAVAKPLDVPKPFDVPKTLEVPKLREVSKPLEFQKPAAVEQSVRPESVMPAERRPVADEESDEELEDEDDIVAEEPVVQQDKAPELPPPPTDVVKPIVEWPPEDQRQVVGLRLVARPPDRFRGNLLRQALAGEGFVLGDLDIFHKPDAENRAVLSAASLTKPGTFDLETMDTQRFTGLNIFAVLPGPKTPQKAFEDLLVTARTLNERLEGALQDDRGGPLTPMRIQALRDALGAEAKS